jgi:hypothetical protein
MAVARPGAASSAPITFKVRVLNDPEGHLKGTFNAEWNSTGLHLIQKERRLLVPVGTPARYLGKNRFQATIETRTVDFAISKIGAYQHRLAQHLVGFLSQQRGGPDPAGYGIPWYLLLPVFLPFGIPIITIGGVIWVTVGLGVSALVLLVVQREELPAAGRAAIGWSLNGVTYLIVLALIASNLWKGLFTALKPNDPDRPPVRIQSAAPTVVPQPAPLDVPRSQPVDRSVAGSPRQVDDLTVMELQGVSRPDFHRGRDVRQLLLWASDGRSFYHADPDGTLRQVVLSGFRETRVLNTGGVCSWLSPSAEGLLLTVSSRQEIWVLDPESLDVRKRIAVPGASVATAGPSQSVAFAGAHLQDRQNSGTLYSVDLKKGVVAREISSRDRFSNSNLVHPIVTPDGKFVFASGGIEQLLCFKVNGDDLGFDDASPRILANGQTIDVSPDSRYVCAPSGGGNYPGVKNHPSVTTYSTYIYPVTDMSRPAFAIHQDAYPHTVAFSRTDGRLFSQNYERQLLIFSASGALQKEYTLAERGSDVQQILAHPDGSRLLLLTDKQLFYVELPGAAPIR